MTGIDDVMFIIFFGIFKCYWIANMEGWWCGSTGGKSRVAGGNDYVEEDK